LPLGDAILAWSFNHDGEVKPELVESRDRNMGISTASKRKERDFLKNDVNHTEGENILNNINHQ
jgi:hypothetical protein